MIYRSILMALTFALMIGCNGQDNTKTLPDTSNSEESARQPKATLYAPTSSFLTQQHSSLNGMVSQFVRAMYQDSKGTYWFGSNGDGIIRYDGKTLERISIEDDFINIAVREIAEDSEGNVWFGTSLGLVKYDGTSFRRFTIVEEEKGISQENEIWGLTIDRKGIIWVGSITGVYQFDGKTFSRFTVPKAKITNAQPMLSENRVGQILEDGKGNLWFQIDGYGITVYDGTSFTHITKENGLPDNNVSDLLEDNEGNIWIGTFYGGVSRYDGKTFTNFTEQGIIKGVEAYSFTLDTTGNIWFSVENIGVYRYDGKDFILFTTDDGLVTNGVISIFEDQKGQLWFGTWSGLSLYDGTTFFDAKDKEPWAQ